MEIRVKICLISISSTFHILNYYFIIYIHFPIAKTSKIRSHIEYWVRSTTNWYIFWCFFYTQT